MQDTPAAVVPAARAPAASIPARAGGGEAGAEEAGDGPRTPSPGLFALPAVSFPILADRCAALGEIGAGVLRDTGRAAGSRLFELLGREAADAAPEVFWTRLGRLLERLGLGRVRFELVDPGLAALGWEGLPEAGPREEGAPRSSAGCHLATGLLAGLLGRAADRPAAALEIACRAASDERCWFLVGSEERLIRIHARLRAGEPPARAMRAD